MSAINNFAWNFPYIGIPQIKPITIACGEGNNTLAYSPDGIYWKGLGIKVFTTRANKAVWTGVRWVAVGTGTYWVATSLDGITWTGQESDILTEAYDIAWNGSYLVAVGYGDDYTIATSNDGITWYGVANSSTIFTTRASSISWTGQTWIALGSGTNTSAICTTKNPTNWTPTAPNNLVVTDMSNSITIGVFNETYGSPGSINSAPPFTRQMTTTTSDDWSSTSAYSNSTGEYTGDQSTTYDDTLTASGEWIQIELLDPVICHYYCLSWLITNTASQYTIARSWSLLGSNDGATWVHIDSYSYPDAAPPVNTNEYPFTIKMRNLFSNAALCNIYRIVFKSIFPGGPSTTTVRLSQCDMFTMNSSSKTIPVKYKPIVTRTHVLYPNSFMKFNDSVGTLTTLIATDLCGNLVDSSFNNGYFMNPILNGANASPITSQSFDGYSMTCTTLSGNILYLTNQSLNTNLNTYKTLSGNAFTTQISGNLNASCYNGQRNIIGGSGGNLISYNTIIETAPSASFTPSLNASKLFTGVNGLASNPGYGTTYIENRIYFKPGERITLVAPRAYNQNMMPSNAFSFTMKNAEVTQNLVMVTFGNQGPSGSAGAIGFTGLGGLTGVDGSPGAPGPNDYQLWESASTTDLTLNGNLAINKSVTTDYAVDISGNFSTTTLTLSDVSASGQTIVVDGSTNTLNVDDFTVNGGNQEINNATTYLADISGTVNVSKVTTSYYEKMNTSPNIVNSQTASISITQGQLYFDIGTSMSSNFILEINGFPVSLISETFTYSFELIIDYINSPVNRYYCNQIKLGASTIPVAFTGGEPEVGLINTTTSIIKQVMHIFCTGGTIKFVGCDFIPYIQ